MAKKRKADKEAEAAAKEEANKKVKAELNGHSNGNDSEDSEAQEGGDEIAKLLEPFSKEQLIGLIRDAAKKRSDVMDNIRSLADKDVSHRKVFVHGLGSDASSETLKSAFSQYGVLEECTVIMDKGTGKSKGYGFVTFKQMKAAKDAVKEISKKIDGRTIFCQMAFAGPTLPQPANELTGRKIYVSNVPADMAAEKLLNHFKKYGEVDEGPLGFDKQTGKSRGYALFIYKSPESAKKALEEPTKNIDGHSVHCKKATENQKQKKNNAPSAVTGPLDPNDLALTHGKGSILGAAGIFPFNQGLTTGYGAAYNALLAGQGQNFGGLNPALLASLNPSLASSLNPSGLSQGFTPSAQNSLGSGGSYGLGGYGTQHGVGAVNPGLLGGYGSQAVQGLNAYQNQQMSQSTLPRTSQGGGGSLGGMSSYYSH